MNGPDPTDNLSIRSAAAKERSRQRTTAKQLVEAGLAPEVAAVQFLSRNDVQLIVDRARDSNLQSGWKRRSSWDEIIPELTDWLNRQGPVVSGLTQVIASGPWFSERIIGLQRLWRDLYFYSEDGLSGFLVNHDSERGFETVEWGMSNGLARTDTA